MPEARKPAAQKTAEAEVDETPRTIECMGEEFVLPDKMPLKALRYMREDQQVSDIIDFMETILGPEQTERIWELNPDVEEGTEFITEIAKEYGVTPGESPASRDS